MAKEVKNKDVVDSIMYSYSTSSNSGGLEEENHLLKETVSRLKEEIDKYRSNPLMVCEFKQYAGANALIRIPNGNQFHVNISADCDKLNPGDLVLVEQKNLTIIRKMPITRKFNIEKFVIIEKPKISWKDIGGLDVEANEVKEVVELPLKKPELFKKLGITPPKGILLHGPPGTGKTLLAKAVAASTNSTFIEVVGSEIVQKFIGEGSKLVKEIFEYARKKAPAVVFIDELDSLASKRVELGTSGEREVNRTFMQLLAELDGFHPLDNVKIIGATNRKDILDPAMLRPGRLDRIIYIPNPNKEARKQIFAIHSKDMTMEKGINTETIVDKMDGFSGAEIKAVCTEAGYFAIRQDRSFVKKEDFFSAVEKVKREEKEDGEFLKHFG
jgi:proteasome regulatory subunit